MSRNKDIKYLQKASRKSYKECRKIMKDNHWDLISALVSQEIADVLVISFAQKAMISLARHIEETIPKAVEEISNRLSIFSEHLKDSGLLLEAEDD